MTRYQDGNETASFTGRIAWEKLMSETTMIGYFLGASASKTNIIGSFSGDQNSYGLQTGAYFVQELDRNLFWDGFVAASVGQNALELNNGTLDVSGDYLTGSLQAGLAISGVKEYDGFELRPELSLAYGYTQIGEVDLAAATSTSALEASVDAGDVALGVLRVTPEISIPVNVLNDVYDMTELQIAPSLVCEMSTTNATDRDCGGGLELEWTSFSDDGLHAFSASMSREVVGQSSRNSFGVRFEMGF